jgi:hypothetical protein
VRLEFDWDPDKAASNLAKHDVTFEEAMTVFLDPLSLSRLDGGSPPEERWVTLGRSTPDHLLVVFHTYVEWTDDSVYIRIISARRATGREARQYEGGLEA